MLEGLDEARQPRVRLVSVDHAMIDGESDVGHRPNEDRVFAVDLSHDHAFLQFSNSKNGGLTLIEDDRRSEQRTRYAVIGNREGSSRNVGTLEPALARETGEMIELCANLFEREVWNILTTGTTRPFSPSAVPTPILIADPIAIRSSSHRPLIAGAAAMASPAALIR